MHGASGATMIKVVKGRLESHPQDSHGNGHLDA